MYENSLDTALQLNSVQRIVLLQTHYVKEFLYNFLVLKKQKQNEKVFTSFLSHFFILHLIVKTHFQPMFFQLFLFSNFM